MGRDEALNSRGVSAEEAHYPVAAARTDMLSVAGRTMAALQQQALGQTPAPRVVQEEEACVPAMVTRAALCV